MDFPPHLHFLFFPPPPPSAAKSHLGFSCYFALISVLPLWTLLFPHFFCLLRYYNECPYLSSLWSTFCPTWFFVHHTKSSSASYLRLCVWWLPSSCFLIDLPYQDKAIISDWFYKFSVSISMNEFFCSPNKHFFPASLHFIGCVLWFPLDTCCINSGLFF